MSRKKKEDTKLKLESFNSIYNSAYFEQLALEEFRLTRTSRLLDELIMRRRHFHSSITITNTKTGKVSKIED